MPLIILDSVVKVIKKYYPQTLLEECKYDIKKTKMENLIDDDLGPSLSDESDYQIDSDSDNETDKESDNDSNNESNN